MKYTSRLFSGALLCSLAAFCAAASSANAKITINEIAWMGTAGSQYGEWIELYNGGEDVVSLEGWKLTKAENQTLFTLSKSIAAKGYLLVERTTASAPDAVAGIDDESGSFGNGGLKNTGENLILKDKDGNAVDSVLFASGWPAGDAKTKETMQWSGTSWITGTGTPDAENIKKAVTVPPATTHPSSTPPPAPAAAVQTPAAAQLTSPVTVTPAAVAPAVEEDKEVAATPVPVPPADVIPVASVPQPAAPVSSTNKTPVAAVSAAKAAPAKKAKAPAKKSSGTAIAASTASNDTAADQLQASADIPKENNRTKIIIFGAVAFIGMALFLLLGRFNASKE